MALTYAVNDTDILDNCVSWWALNEYSDASGAVTRVDAHSTNDLTDTNTVASATGNWNRGANLVSANTEYLRIADNASLSVTGSLTLSCWVKHTTTPSTGVLQRYISKTDGTASGEAYFLTLINSGGTLQLYGQCRQNSTSGVTTVQRNWTPSTSTWYHVAMVFDATAQTIKLYVDGSQLGATETSTVSAIQDTTAPLDIGGRGTLESMNGVIQDASVHNTALTDTQISRLYNSGDGMTYGVAFDTAQNNSYSNSHSFGTSYTFSHTCTGTDRFLIVSAAVGLGTSPSVTGVTYNGVSMTYIGGYATAPGALTESKVFVLANPASGSNTVSVQTSGSGTGYMYVASGSYTGVDQTTPNPHNNKNQGTGTSLTLTIDTSTSPSTDNCWLVMGGVTNGNYTASAGAGTTKRTSGVLTNWNNIYDNNVAITPAGSDSLVANIATSSLISLVGVSLSPVAVAAASTFTPKMMMF